MDGFWTLLSLLISLTGFIVTGAVLLIRGDSLTAAVVRAVIVFIVLYMLQRVLGSLLVAVLGGSSTSQHPTAESDEGTT